MATDKRRCTKEQLENFAKGTILAFDIPCADSFENFMKHCVEHYQISMEDIKEALQHFREKQWKPVEIIYGWIIPLESILWSHLGVPALLGMDVDEFEEFDLWSMDAVLSPTTEKEMFLNVLLGLSELVDDWECGCYDEDAFYNGLIDIHEQIQYFYECKDKPKEEYQHTIGQKEAFIMKYDDVDCLAKASDENKALYRKYVDELCEMNHIYALYTKGYACYGEGHPVYACDWVTSRDCMLKLLEFEEGNIQGQAANTLGYIYYYGRCNDGVPQYEEAYKYFSLAAFQGLHQAMYKVGDMLATGKGVPKNGDTAYKLYQTVYEDCMKAFLMGQTETEFADVALRMGNAYENGIGTWKDDELAYFYYLQAKLAIGLRMNQHNQYGDNVVAENINNAYLRLKEKLGNAVTQSSAIVDSVYFIKDFMKDEKYIVCEVKEKKNGYKLTFSLQKNEYGFESNRLLIFPEMSYCKLVSQASIVVSDGVKLKTDEKKFIIDQMKIKKSELHFYFKKKLVLSIPNGSAVFYQSPKKKSKMEYKFVTIRFNEEGKTYDYLCDDEVVVGDQVIVSTYAGKQTVPVEKVFTRKEEDIPFNLERYKKAKKVLTE